MAAPKACVDESAGPAPLCWDHGNLHIGEAASRPYVPAATKGRPASLVEVQSSPDHLRGRLVRVATVARGTLAPPRAPFGAGSEQGADPVARQYIVTGHLIVGRPLTIDGRHTQQEL